jgi:hypothetical protein
MSNDESNNDAPKEMSEADVKKNFRLVEKSVDLKDAIEEYSGQLSLAFQPMFKLKAKQLGRVVRALMKAPIVDITDELKNMGAEEHKLLISLMKLRDASNVLIEAMDEPDEESTNTPEPKEAS